MKTKSLFSKTRLHFSMWSSVLVLAMSAMSITSCSTDAGEDSIPEGLYSFTSDAYGEKSGGTDGSAGTGEIPNTQAGVVTAGEWCDLNQWSFWAKLMLGQDFAEKSDYWKFYTNNRVALKVTDASGNAIAGVPVGLMRDNTTIWKAVTDNHGLADCWAGLFQKETANADNLSVTIGGQLMEGHPTLCTWDSLGNAAVNEYVYTAPSVTTSRADIAFIVDATGSMADEISFLKDDLEDIISKAASVRPEIAMRTAALFYRDEGDEYLTIHSDFTDKLSDTRKYVNEQNADGGGDYPEAVHTALERMLQNLSWDDNARTKLAFLVLDAPAHHENDIISSLQHSIEICAQKGIRIIPVAASGTDKNTEFMLRFFAIATGGTYVFLTDHSGVGNPHMAASVGEYEVEQLNELLIRLIEYYTE